MALANVNIKTLRLAYCESITSEGLAAVAAGCPNLTGIELTGCSAAEVTLQTIANLVRGCRKLTRIAILRRGNPQWKKITRQGSFEHIDFSSDSFKNEDEDAS
jgi:hypothetical protein